VRGDPNAISAALTGREPPVPRGAPASRGRTHREAPERVSSVQGNPMGAADPSASPQRKPRGPRDDPPVPIRTDPGAHSRRFPSRGAERRKRARGIASTPVDAADRDGALRRGTPRGSGLCVGRRQTRVSGPRAVGRRRVFLLLFLRAAGAETLRQSTAKPRFHGDVVAWRLGGRRLPRNGVRTPWTAAASSAAKRAGSKPSRR